MVSPAHCDASVARNVPELIQPTLRAMKKTAKGLMTVSAMEKWKKKGNKKE